MGHLYVHVHVPEELTGSPVAARGLPFTDWQRQYREWTTDYIFERTFADMAYMAQQMRQMRQSGTRPEIEVYDVGQIYNHEQWVRDGVLAAPFNLQFVLEVLSATPPHPTSSSICWHHRTNPREGLLHLTGRRSGLPR